MDYKQSLYHHFKPKKGWINDPNGLVYYKGMYHIFYQHCPDFEVPGKQPMHWGHAVTKNFIDWEELPVALTPEADYESGGCWSGTAIVKDDILYLIYSSVINNGEGYCPKIKQTVSIAYSEDGINFKKYENNPVISDVPSDGDIENFRDPAVFYTNNTYYCIIASGHSETKTARLLLYKSDNLFNWEYSGVMVEWQSSLCAECPSFVPMDDKFLLVSSVIPLEGKAYFELMYGTFENEKFKIDAAVQPYKGPDQYAGQLFRDANGRNILISWIPGWAYHNFSDKNIGCMSSPCEIKLKNGRLSVFPVKEVRHLLKNDDSSVKITKNGFIIERKGREAVEFTGELSDLKILRDGYVIELFINNGENVYTAIL